MVGAEVLVEVPQEAEGDRREPVADRQRRARADGGEVAARVVRDRQDVAGLDLGPTYAVLASAS